jgi:hypothetical protein
VNVSEVLLLPLFYTINANPVNALPFFVTNEPKVAVLGIVELGVHILQQFHTFDKDRKAVFADIHFLLFYTDILNAMQAIIQAFATKRVSNRLWVRTEELELDHYVEIREEYDRVHEELYGVPPDMDSSISRGHDRQTHNHRARRSGFLNSILRPGLRTKYKELLLQVRFHELRLNFLKAYKLPLKLKVSDYLMRSESSVLISMVHISPAAWLWLTAVCNVLYYLGGIIVQATGDENAAATFFSIVFFVGIFSFIGMSLMADAHMQWILNRIMYVPCEPMCCHSGLSTYNSSFVPISSRLHGSLDFGL